MHGARDQLELDLRNRSQHRRVRRGIQIQASAYLRVLRGDLTFFPPLPLPHFLTHHFPFNHHANTMRRVLERVAVVKGDVAVFADFQGADAVVDA